MLLSLPCRNNIGRHGGGFYNGFLGSFTSLMLSPFQPLQSCSLRFLNISFCTGAGERLDSVACSCLLEPVTAWGSRWRRGMEHFLILQAERQGFCLSKFFLENISFLPCFSNIMPLLVAEIYWILTLLHARHCAAYFPCTGSLAPHNNPTESVLILPLFCRC